MTSAKRKWTPSEIAVLRRSVVVEAKYPSEVPLDRSEDAIRDKAMRMGMIPYRVRRARWTEEQKRQLSVMRNSGVDVKEMVRYLPFSTDAIYQQLRRMK